MPGRAAPPARGRYPASYQRRTRRHRSGGIHDSAGRGDQHPGGARSRKPPNVRADPRRSAAAGDDTLERMAVLSPPTSRLALEDLAGRVLSALGHPFSTGTWSDEELVPYTERHEWSRRELGAIAVTLSITRNYCDSSAGPRELGATASMMVEAGDGRRVSCQWPPLRWTGDPGLLATLADAGLPVDGE